MLFSFAPMAGRLQCAMCAAFIAVSFAALRSGQAQIEYRLSAGTAVGASDNPVSQSPGTPAQGDGFATVQANILLKYLGRLATEQFAYGIIVTTWLQRSQSPFINHRLTFSTEIEAAPSVRVSLGSGAVLSQLSMADVPAAAGSQTAGPRPAGNQKFLALEGFEGIAWQIDGQWRLDQRLGGTLYRPLSSGSGLTENKGLTLNLGLGRQWSRDWGGLQSRLGAMTSSRTSQDGQPFSGIGSSEIAELLLNWRHDWTAEFAHDVGAGVMFTRTDQTHPLPAAFAGVSWRRTGLDVSLRVAQTADYSVFVGTAYERRSITLRASLPLNRLENLGLAASANLERDTTADAAPGAAGSVDVFMGQLGLNWRPGNTFAFSLAYTFRDQRAAAADTGTSAFSSLRRQTIMLSVDALYPNEF